MMDLKEFDAALKSYIRPQTFPLAIRMAREGEAMPKRAKFPLRDLRVRVAVCQGFAIARRYGWTLAMRKEDISCPPAKVVFGFEEAIPYYTRGELCAGTYTETIEAGAISEAQIEKFEFGEYKSILVSPLHRAAFEPHLVLIYGNPAQVMRLVIASLWKRGGRLRSGFSGRIDCSDIVVVTIRSKEPQVILPCYGERVFGQTHDDEMAFAIPAARLEEVAEGLEGTHKGGIRYPIPGFLRYEGEFPAKYRRMEEIWERGA
jgi:uncharacterized protein (DUF169 family)